MKMRRVLTGSVSIRYFIEGCTKDGEFDQEVRTRDLRKVKLPQGVIFFRFYDKIVGSLQDEKGHVVHLTRDDKLNISNEYFCDGLVMGYAEALRRFPKRRSEIRDIVVSTGFAGFPRRVVLANDSNFYLFDKGDSVL